MTLPILLTSTQASTQFAHNLIEAWNSHDIDRIAAFYAPDYEDVDVARPNVQHGTDDFRRVAAYYLRALPDLHITLDDLIVGEDGRAALAWTWRGTHKGTLMKIPPTGRTVTVRGTTLLTLADGKIQRSVRIWDVAGLLRAVGLLPEL
jgi:steroid delta-isomerase-like uncharacterized protein